MTRDEVLAQIDAAVRAADVREVRTLLQVFQAMCSENTVLTAEDKRWRFLEHGCQWVSWTPTGGETVSFDPRDVKHLKGMRESADEMLHEQVAQLRAEAEELERRWKR